MRGNTLLVVKNMKKKVPSLGGDLGEVMQEFILNPPFKVGTKEHRYMGL